MLLDVLLPDPFFGPDSATALREAIDSGVVVACEIVWAEVRAAFSNDAAMAGALWRQYRSRAKDLARAHLISDFLVGAHALLQTETLLSRDRGFYRRYFTDLKLIDPSA